MRSFAPDRRRLFQRLGGILLAPALAQEQEAMAQDAAPLFSFVYALHADAAQRGALEAWSQVLARYAPDWWRTITRELAAPGIAFPDHIELLFAAISPPGIPALTRRNEAGHVQIVVDADGLLGRIHSPDTLRMVAHEMVHAAQAYPHAPSWLVEGIADYLRYYVLFPDDPARAFKASSGGWRDGYQPTAALLDWIERAQPGAVGRLNQALFAGEDGEQALTQAAGRPLAAAWTAYLASKPAAITRQALNRRIEAQVAR